MNDTKVKHSQFQLDRKASHYTHTSWAKSDSKLKLRGSVAVHYWHGITNTCWKTRTITRTQAGMWISIYQQRSEKARPGRYLRWQGHQVKWSSRWREVNKRGWMQYKRGEKKRETLLNCPRGQSQKSCDLMHPLFYIGSKHFDWTVHNRPSLHTETLLHMCLLYISSV